MRVPGNLLYPALTSPWEAEISPASTLHFARRVDALGFDFMWVAEHMIQVPRLVESMGPRFYEGLTAAAVLLGATRRIRALTYVSVLPYHPPVVYAKAVATVDFLSEGRITLGLAAGHSRREFAAIGVPFSERGRRVDEYLRAMRELWTSERPSFHGEFVEFEDVIFEPKPIQKPHPPVLLGGDAPAVLRRAARLADGWMPWLTTPEELPSRLAYIREQPGMRERVRPFEVLALLASFPDDDRFDLGRYRIPRERSELVEMTARLQEAGATGVVVHPPKTSGLDECLEWIEGFASDVMPAFGKRAASETSGGNGPDRLFRNGKGAVS